MQRDITERKRTQEELLKAKENAEKSDRLKSAFLANMSHEIRTPMNAIVGFAGMISDPDLTEEERNKFTGIIQSRSEDLLHLVNDLLEISRIESGNAVIVKSEVNLNLLLREIDTVTRQKLEKIDKSHLSVECIRPMEDKEIAFIGDPYILKQVYSNLLDNALKYTHSGSIAFGYSIPENGVLTCFVADTGIGISPQNHALIFEHFRQAETEGAHKYGGTGLGLAICKGSLELLGGRIWVESVRGEGSTFRFAVPFEKPAIPVLLPETELPFSHSDPTTYSWEGKRVLIVEDDQANLEFIKIILGRTQAELTCVEQGNELRKLFPELDRFDIVLLDIRLPDASGWDLAKDIKALRPGLPVIAQTAYAMSTDRQKSGKAGCDDYISKPISKNLLLDMMAKYLGGK